MIYLTLNCCMATVSSEADSKQHHCMVHICLSKGQQVMIDERIKQSFDSESQICRSSCVPVQ